MALTKRMKDMTPEEKSDYFRTIRKNVKKPTGFAAMDKDRLKAISSKGGSMGGRARQTKQGGESEKNSPQAEKQDPITEA